MSEELPGAASIDREPSGAGGRLVSINGRLLPLREIALRGEAAGGLARIVLEQRFYNPHPDPLRVTYQVPLPPEAAVSGYSFQIGPRRVVGEVDRAAAARERFEQALLEGQTAGLLEQDRSSLFTQEIGNIPAGAEVLAELVIDQRLRWLEEGAWEWRCPTVVAPRYLGAVGRVPDGERVTVDVADRPFAVAASLTLAIRDSLSDAGAAAGHAAQSPSHAIRTRVVSGATEVTLADDGARGLDRDLVIRWPAGRPTLAVVLDTGRPAEGRSHAGSAYGLLTITPPRPDEHAAGLPRDLIVLLDMSGSMAGKPLDQARRVVAGLIEVLGETDQLELIGFADRPKRWKSRAVRARAAVRREAIAWLERLEAGGGTEMQSGVTEALRPLRPAAQRQVVLVTDGEIGFESEIVGLILRQLPAGCCLHTVGVGPAVNRTLTAGAARAGRGAEIVLGLDEDPEPAIRRLRARLDAPLLTDLKVSGSAVLDHAPRGVPDVCVAAPVLVAVRLRPEGGHLTVTGRLRDKTWEEQVSVPTATVGTGNPAVPTLYGRELVEDLETRRTAGEDGTVELQIERTGLDFQIATRLTSWVAVSEEATVDPAQPIRRERIPQAVPQGLSVEGLGLRAPAMVARLTQSGPMRQRIVGAPLYLRQPSFRGAFAGPHKVVVQLRGRIVLWRDRQLVVEIVVDGRLEWKPSRAVVVWSGGEAVRATIDPAATTRPGTFFDDHVIRLVLRLSDPAPTATPERVSLGGEAMSVVLSAIP
jgi:Ca-activated chloride channel family protein